MADAMYEVGKVCSHASAPEAGADVGISIGLGGGAMLYAGQVPGMIGAWSLAIYTEKGRIDIADSIDRDAAETMIGAISAIVPRTFIAARKPLEDWGVRELARATGISPTTASRVKNGEGLFDSETMRAVWNVTGECLCCGAKKERANG